MVKTIKQQRLAKAVADKNNYGRPLSDIAKEVGYAEGSRAIYREGTRKHILEAFKDKGIDKDSLTHSFEALTHLCLKDRDYSNAHRGLENIAKLSGLLKQEGQVVINQAQILDSIRAVDRAEKVIDETKV